MNLMRMILGGLRASLEAVFAGMLDNRYSPVAVGGPRPRPSEFRDFPYRPADRRGRRDAHATRRPGSRSRGRRA